MATILQAPLLTDFLYPMLLMFFLVFAILEKTKILGDKTSQLNAGVSLVISLIFVGAVFPKIIVENMILYMSVALFVVFVGLMFWGFVSGNTDLTVTDDKGRKIRKFFAFLIGGGVVFALFWATGVSDSVIDVLKKLLGLLFGSGWSGDFWMNFLFILIIVVAICVVLGVNPLKKLFSGDGWIRLGK